MMGMPSGGVAAMLDCLRRAVGGGNPIALFGMVYVMECLAVASLRAGVEAARIALNLDDSVVQGLIAPGAIQDQARFFTTLMTRIVDPGDQRAIIDAARDIFGHFGALFAGAPADPRIDV